MDTDRLLREFGQDLAGTVKALADEAGEEGVLALFDALETTLDRVSREKRKAAKSWLTPAMKETLRNEYQITLKETVEQKVEALRRIVGDEALANLAREARANQALRGQKTPAPQVPAAPRGQPPQEHPLAWFVGMAFPGANQPPITKEKPPAKPPADDDDMLGWFARTAGQR